MKFNDVLKKTTMLDLKVGNVPALMGEPGIGKSSFVEGLAQEMDTRAFVVACNQLADKADLTGARLVPYTKGDGSQAYKQVFYPHHIVQEAIDYAEAHPREWPILFLDELNRTTPDVTSAALTLVTMRRLGASELPKNLRLMIAGNDKGNITALDEASLSRFAIYHVEPDAVTLIALLGDKMNPWVKKVLEGNNALVFAKPNSAIAVDGNDDDDDDDRNVTVSVTDAFETGEEMNQFTTPRTIEYVSHWLNESDNDDLKNYLATPAVVDGRDTTLLHELLEAHTGQTTFTEALIGVMSEDFINNTTQGAAATTVQVGRPNCYDDLMTAGSIDELNQKIANLTEHERSGSLVYAIYDKRDNARLIEHLAMATPALEQDHLQKLVRLVSDSDHDQQNLEAFTSSSAPVAQSVSQTLLVFQ